VRLLAGIVAAATLATPHLHFPRDHYGHHAGIEWWYFTGYVQGSDGHPYSVFFTLFERAGFVLPVSQAVNLDTGAIVEHSEQLDRATIGPTRLAFLSQHANLRYDGTHTTWHAGVGGTNYELALAARPVKGYVLHGGGTGIVRQGAATSRYYSATRMTMTGTLRPRGGKRISFTGTGWFDHQWGDFTTEPSASHWDWFSCRFDDRTELMLYRFRDGHMNGTAVDRAGHGRLVQTFAAKPGTRVYRAAGRSWPLDWALDVPSQHLTERLHAIVPDQLFRSILLPAFWEGAVTATGTKSGVCFVEETS
jgi:predicted secreted hydrolase